MPRELTKEQTLDQIQKSVAFMRKLIWLCAVFSLGGYAISLISTLVGDLKGGITFLAISGVFGFLLLQYKQERLILKMFGAPSDDGETAPAKPGQGSQ